MERTDKERLDWLERHHPPTWIGAIIEMDGSWLAGLNFGSSDDPESYGGDTIREAIDAAMAAEESS